MRIKKFGCHFSKHVRSGNLMDMITREEIINAIKKLGEMPKERPSIEEMEKNIALCKKLIDVEYTRLGE